MTRVLIHAGFHKTATTAVQKRLVDTRRSYDKFAKFASIKPLWAARRAARRYSESLSPLHLIEFAAMFQNDLARIFSDLGERKLIIASEEFCGHLPGRPKVKNYSAAPALMGEISHALTAYVDAQDVTFYFSTRDEDMWLRSAYCEHVKSSALMTLDWECYASSHAKSLEVDEILAKITDTVSPSPVVICNIDSIAPGPNGIIAPVLDILDAPDAVRQKIATPGVLNKSLPSEIIAELLAINRQGGSHDDISAQKKAVIKRYRAALS